MQPDGAFPWLTFDINVTVFEKNLEIEIDSHLFITFQIIRKFFTLEWKKITASNSRLIAYLLLWLMLLTFEKINNGKEREST